MSPSASDPPTQGSGRGGFTVVEAVVALCVAAMLGVGVLKFYRDSYSAYSVQEQTVERNQNANYLVNRFVEVLQQAGATLPDSGWDAITFLDGVALKLGVNPRGVEYFVGANSANTMFQAVSDASLFANTGNVLLNTTHVLIDYMDPARAVQRVAIDLAYNFNGYRNGIKDNARGMDSIKLTRDVRVVVGDRIYGYREDHYLLSGGNLIIRPNGSPSEEMVLAEHIDHLEFTFRDERNRPTTVWQDMRSASFTVRARTAKPDPKLPPPGYRTITLPMNVILRNRI